MVALLLILAVLCLVFGLVTTAKFLLALVLVFLILAFFVGRSSV
jgi:hypothetical protein